MLASADIIRYAYYMSGKGTTEEMAIVRAVLALGRRLRAERTQGSVTLAGLSLLGTLARRGPLLAMELAAAERLQPQSLTRLIAGLERDGLIARRRSEADGRALSIMITDAGRAVLAADIAAREAWLRTAMAEVLSAEERASLATAAAAMMKLAFSVDRDR